MHATELTMSEMLRDPMIRLMLRADRVPLGDFAKLLEDAASARTKGRQEDAQSSRSPLAH
ncbi:MULTISPECIES: hypothetical protein [Rhizobium]|uniref:Uncharacterized protein n=1 Tax=Rhizobium rhododendri TaxID=2506430 RepID=A0ABY8IFX2_9HYPH|nr:MULTISPECIES: hypothetical protein [Rhizobium]MBZ5763006.1 hypothetical protein [Rhizobium sp. VS19-DR96]MBZ5768878.1 hypothetical protein [Rhizobium sp. VS19-DR129.2]MBZ5776506.1 hypothetical protein [Rhizobium sp. VS19-DRK62.2]MBZ5787662.1 hypothetical protein [Rhizobium sp. VS19-DR121]MBZ5805165.1 hypothetical protein [Rhizobium sp. VS19-DR181]